MLASAPEKTGLSAGLQLFGWCIAGSAAVYALLQYFASVAGFSEIFRYLLKAHDLHGNFLLFGIALAALGLRHRPEALRIVDFAAKRPWVLALALFPLLCFASITAYHAYPLSMDEYATLFQAQVFAAGHMDGLFPPDLVDRLILRPFQAFFLVPSHATGQVATGYWPGYSALLAPFVWLGVPWALNPLLGALTVPSLHRLACRLTGSEEAAGWAVLLTVASPVFIVTSISFYSMPAHLLADLWYGALLIRPTPRKALLAGLIGSVALVLHVPPRHILFSFPFLLWLTFGVRSWPVLRALIAGYLPVCLVVGLGWQLHLASLRGGPGLPAIEHIPSVFALSARARIAGLTKVWTWGTLGLVPLAVLGAWLARGSTEVRLFAAALATTFFAYMAFGGDQGHGWGNRALYSAWFVVPLLAAIGIVQWKEAGTLELRQLSAWGAVLSLVLANGLRIMQVDTFISTHLRQVPPLASPVDPARPEVVLVQLGRGFYTQDMIHNDPFLRGRVVMGMGDRAIAEGFVTRHFPRYAKAADAGWGELWVRTAR